MPNCVICDATFVKKSWNAVVCSNACRLIKNKLACKEWHIKNIESENFKSRERMKRYSTNEIRDMNRRYRQRRKLNILDYRKCLICSSSFFPKRHNSKVCSDNCRRVKNANRNKRYFQHRYSKDINFKLASILRTRINKILTRNMRPKSVIDSVGCSINELKTHLESKFQPGMSWYNYGEWHIDHVRPLSSFDLTDEIEYKEACHYTNLQPLWAADNLSKGNKE